MASLKCACFEHGSWTGEKKVQIFKLKSKKYKVSTIEFMKSEYLMPLHASALCIECVYHVENNLLPKRQKLTQTFNCVEDIITAIDNGDMCNEDMNGICMAIGRRISRLIEVDTQSVPRDSDELIASCDVDKYLQKRNSTLVSFVSAAAACQESGSQRKRLCVAIAVDNIYKARNSRHVSPIAFCANLLSYHISGSKLLTNLNSVCNAGGSYPTLKFFLKNASQSPKSTFKSQDCVCFFDNNQVIARNWRVNLNYKTPVCVSTNVIQILSGTHTGLQSNGQLSPRQWLHGATNDRWIPLVKDYLKKGCAEMDRIRDAFVQQRITKVIADGDPLTSEGLICKVEDTDPYSWVPSQHAHPTTVVVGEPLMENPCSYASVERVLRNIRQQCEVDEGRQWLPIGCDGLPYSLACRLIETDATLQDLLMLSGPGHIEMNMVKGCFKLLWDAVLKDVAKMMGYRTPRALLCCQNCTDHHKAWMILKIFFFGTLDEIIHMFTSSNEQPLTPSGLYAFIEHSTNPNFRFIADAIFQVVLPVFTYRSGIRRNNSTYVTAAKIQFSELFFGLNMTCYQELCIRDFKTRVLAPEVVQEFLQQHEGYSISGHDSKGEGGDFVLEAVNRKCKRWLPPGIPSKHHWEAVCRNADTLDQIREKTMEQMDLHEESPSIYQRDIGNEVLAWRRVLRNSKYICSASNESGCHTAFDGPLLDRELVAFRTKCNTNLQRYLEAISRGVSLGRRVDLDPVFTTPENRTKFHSIEKKTKAQISTMIESAIQTISDNGHVTEALLLQNQWQKTKVGTKAEMVMFYKEVTVALENATETDSGT